MHIVTCQHGAVSASGEVCEETRNIVIKIRFDRGMSSWAKGDLALFVLEQDNTLCLLLPVLDQSRIPCWLIATLKELRLRPARIALIVNGAGSVTVVVYDSPSSYGYESNEVVILQIVLAIASGLETVKIGA